MSRVTVDGVFKSYGGFPILERIGLEVASGTFVTLVGASGCGKTTFLRMLLSQERPDRGAILIDGEPIAPEPTPDRGIVFQRYSVFPHMSVWYNLVLGREFASSKVFGRLFGTARRRACEDVEETLRSIGLWQARDRLPAQLSGGMQQRLAIGQALLMKPKIMLLDEPFGALDPGIRADMHEFLLDLWRERGMTIFMVTHDIREAFKLGTRLLVFDKVRHDPQQPNAYGATITYDLPIKKPQEQKGEVAPMPAIIDEF